MQLGRWDYDHRPGCPDYEPPPPLSPVDPTRYCRLCDTYASAADPAVPHLGHCPRHPRNLGRENYRAADPEKAPTRQRPGSLDILG